MHWTKCGSHLLLLILIVSQLKSGNCVKCYVCDWSPVENRTDFCTASNFQPDEIKSFTCKRGCEYVSKIDTNGAIVSFFRNCANAEAPLQLTCRKTPGKDMTRYACTCNSDLCNGVSSPGRSNTPSNYVALTVAMIVLVNMGIRINI